ncbi:MAG: enoyl-CoA hydratase/isomerase family protein [Acidocella sp.]|nr:enoyl-CoA hydratase/isomerase family protein [Acidocella sp.]
MSDRYAKFDRFLFDHPAPWVLRITMNRPEKMNAMDWAMDHQLATIWAAVDADPAVRVTIITGAGKAFCAGGDFSGISGDVSADPVERFNTSFKNARGLAMGIVNSRKPIISAINGAAVGAGLAVALLADISIASKTAKLFDGHTRIGVAAGDHAAMIWPLLCGIAKTKYFLLSNEPMTGEEAERHNLVSLAVDADQLQDRALEIATRIANTAPSAVAYTKYAVNHWLRQAEPIFDLSLALELIGFEGAEAREALASIGEKRPPVFGAAPTPPESPQDIK